MKQHIYYYLNCQMHIGKIFSKETLQEVEKENQVDNKKQHT